MIRLILIAFNYQGTKYKPTERPCKYDISVHPSVHTAPSDFLWPSPSFQVSAVLLKSLPIFHISPSLSGLLRPSPSSFSLIYLLLSFILRKSPPAFPGLLPPLCFINRFRLSAVFSVFWSLQSFFNILRPSSSSYFLSGLSLHFSNSSLLLHHSILICPSQPSS